MSPLLSRQPRDEDRIGPGFPRSRFDRAADVQHDDRLFAGFVEGVANAFDQPVFRLRKVVVGGNDAVEQFAGDAADRDDGRILRAGQPGDFGVRNLHLRHLRTQLLRPPALRRGTRGLFGCDMAFVSQLQFLVRFDSRCGEPLCERDGVGAVHGAAAGSSRYKVV